MSARLVFAVVFACAACNAPPQTTAQPGTPPPSVANPATVRDTALSALIPAGYGSLRSDSVSIQLNPGDVIVRLIPLEESVIRVLAPDSYRQLHAALESRRDQIDRLARSRGFRERHVWQATFIGLAPDARFNPTDITITSAGRDFRPVEVIPLTPGFGEQRLQPRDQQKALLLFDDAVDVTQPLLVRMGSLPPNASWEQNLQAIDREREAIRARTAGGKPD